MYITRGFTLIELLVVISIIGMLSSVIFGSVLSTREKARIAAGLTFERHIMSALGDRVIARYQFDDEDQCTGGQLDRSIAGWGGSRWDLVPGGTIAPCDDVLSSGSPSGSGTSLEISELSGNYGTDGYVQAQQFGNVSVGMWINGSSSANNSVIQFDTGGVNPSTPSLVFFGSDAYLVFSADTFSLPTATLLDDRWHHLFVSFYGDKATVSIDGTQAAAYDLSVSASEVIKDTVGITLIGSTGSGRIRIDNLTYFGDGISF